MHVSKFLIFCCHSEPLHFTLTRNDNMYFAGTEAITFSPQYICVCICNISLQNYLLYSVEEKLSAVVKNEGQRK